MNSRDRRQLGANLWRSKVVICRNKLGVLKALNTTVMYFIIFIVTAFLTAPVPQDAVAFKDNNYAVASSTPGSNYFISDSIDIQNDFVYDTPLELGNCTKLGAKSIGIIEDTANTDLASEANDMLVDIAQRMVTAYQA